VTTTATEDTAQAETPEPLTLIEIRAWRRQERERLFARLSPEVEGSVNLCQAAMERAAYMQPEPLPKRVPQPYSTHPHAPFPVAEVSPQPPESPMHGFTPMPFSEEALANVEKRAEEEAAAQQQQASTASLTVWAKGKTLADEKSDEALENLLDIHDTDPAGESLALPADGEDDPESE
jgi:hypothetical protein